MNSYLIDVVKRGAGSIADISPLPRSMPDFSAVGAVNTPTTRPELQSPFSLPAETYEHTSTLEATRTTIQDMAFVGPRAGFTALPLSHSTPAMLANKDSLVLELTDRREKLKASGATPAMLPKSEEQEEPPQIRSREVRRSQAEDQAPPSSDHVGTQPSHESKLSPQNRVQPQIPGKETGASKFPQLLQGPHHLEVHPELPNPPEPFVGTGCQTQPPSSEERSQIAPGLGSSWETWAPNVPLMETKANRTVLESPRIEVRIGRVEIRVANPPLTITSVSSRRPCGFKEFSRSRSYLDRKWY